MDFILRATERTHLPLDYAYQEADQHTTHQYFKSTSSPNSELHASKKCS